MISFLHVILRFLPKNIFPQKKTLRYLENKLWLSKRKGGRNGYIKIRVTIRTQIHISTKKDTHRLMK